MDEAPVVEIRPIKRRKKAVSHSGKFAEKSLLHEDGRVSSLTLPIRRMTRDEYQEELSAHTGFNAFLKERPLKEIKMALSRDGSPKATKFLKALLHPKNAKADIAVIATKCGISYGDLITLWRSDKLSEAMSNVFARMPVVAEHTAIDAQSSIECCPRCDGSGMMRINREEVISWVECIQCTGTGGVRKAGDKASRQFVFETTGLIKSGPMFSINNNINVSTVESVLDEMERATAPGVVDVTSQELD